MTRTILWAYEGNGGDCIGPYDISTAQERESTIMQLNVTTEESDLPLQSGQIDAIRNCKPGKYVGPDFGLDIEIVEIKNVMIVVEHDTGGFNMNAAEDVPVEVIDQVTKMLSPYVKLE